MKVVNSKYIIVIKFLKNKEQIGLITQANKKILFPMAQHVRAILG